MPSLPANRELWNSLVAWVCHLRVHAQFDPVRWAQWPVDVAYNLANFAHLARLKAGNLPSGIVIMRLFKCR